MSKKKIIIIVVVSIIIFALIAGCAIYFLISFFGKSSKKEETYNLFENGYVAVEKYGEWGVIDKKGKTIIPFEYEEVKVCETGNLFLVKEDGKYGFMNKEGIFKISNIYDDADIFKENGLAPVEKGDKWGYINLKGKYVIKPQYKTAGSFYNHTAVVSKKDKEYLIDEDGNLVFEKGFYYISNISDTDEYYVVSEDKGETTKDGVVDKNGKEVIAPQFDSLDLNDNDTATVEKDEEYGVIGLDGKYILKPEFDKVDYDDRHDLYITKYGDVYNLYDEDGKKIINKDFKNEIGFGELGLSPYKEGKYWGYINTKGKVVIEATFDNAKRFGKYDIAPVKKGGSWRFIDKDGYEVNDSMLKTEITDVDPFTECGLAFYKMDKWGLLNKKINESIISPEWRKFADYYSDVVILGDDDKDIYLINGKGDVIGNTGYEAFGNLSERYCKKDGCYKETVLGDYCTDHIDLEYEDDDLDDDLYDY